MSTNRKQELVEYIELLGNLQGKGLKYSIEINKAVSELNEIVMDDPKSVLMKFLNNASYLSGVNGKLVIVNNKHRGIGKTTALIDFAFKLDVPILVGNHMQVDYIFKLARTKGIDPVANKDSKFRVYHYDKVTRGYNLTNGVLIDDTVPYEAIEPLRDNLITIRGGFIHSDLLI